MSKIFDGVRILDCSQYISGPWARETFRLFVLYEYYISFILIFIFKI